MVRAIASHVRGNLVAYVALLFALGGTGYAAGSKLLPSNSVGTAQVINSSLLAKDFRRGQLPRGARGEPGARGARGPTGAQGAQGVRGATGAQGPAGSPDTPAQVLTKLSQVDGSGSGLDADRLDGIDSTDVTRGAARVLSRDGLGPGGSSVISLPDLGTLTISCASPSATSLTLTFTANGSGPAFVWEGAVAAAPSLTFLTVGTSKTVTISTNQQRRWQIYSTVNGPTASFLISAEPSYNAVNYCYYGLQGLYSSANSP